MLERVQERVQEGHPRAHRPVQERAPQVPAPERVRERVLEGHQRAHRPVREPAPQVPALEPTLKPQEGKFRVHVFTPEQTEDNMPKWKQVSDEIFK